MTSREDRLNIDASSLDATLCAAIRDSVRGETPSPGVREALLRAAAERQRRHSTAGHALAALSSKPSRAESADAWRDWSARSVTISPATALLVHARILNLRMVQ
jgi:hypothetical protein